MLSLNSAEQRLRPVTVVPRAGTTQRHCGRQNDKHQQIDTQNGPGSMTPSLSVSLFWSELQTGHRQFPFTHTDW